MSLFYRQPRPAPTDPDDILIGKCPTCKCVIEVLRSGAVPPVQQLHSSQRHNRNDEAGGFGAWKELWSVECPQCICKGAKILTGDVVDQHPVGPRVYLTKKGG